MVVRVEHDNVQNSCNELVMTDQLKYIRLVIADLYATVVRILWGAATEI